MAKTTTLTLRISEEDKARLEKLAEATNRSKSWLAGEALSEYLTRETWQVARIKEGIAAADRGDFAKEDPLVRLRKKYQAMVDAADAS